MTVTALHSPDVHTPPSRSIVLVTGSSRGIGRAIALEFGRAGWRVAVHCRTERREADQTAAQVAAAGGEALVYAADVRQGPAVQAMVDDLKARWGRVDVLVCNAGAVSSHLVIRHPEAAWTSLIETNLTGTYHCVKACGELMAAQHEGSIVLLGSFAGVHGRPGQAAYAASKAGLVGLLKALAKEWGPHGIRINALLPGWQPTDLPGAAYPADVGDRPDHALRHLPDTDDVARTVYHLARLRGTSGQVWNLDSRIL